MRSRRVTLLIAAAASIAGWAGPALAQAAAAPFAAPMLAEADLRTVAAREDTSQRARSDQIAGVANNSVGENVVTGDARIESNAFQNLSGLSILNVNTGNNVAINAAMNVNISITPGQ